MNVLPETGTPEWGLLVAVLVVWGYFVLVTLWLRVSYSFDTDGW